MNTFHHDFISQCQNDLKFHGYCVMPVGLNRELREFIREQDFDAIDSHFQARLSPKADLFNQLRTLCSFTKTEFIISLRESNNEWEEDGIWHDDGSRDMAFSLSLTETPPEGGMLELRVKGSLFSTFLITPPMGEMIVFQTGKKGYEHKINAVTKGSRLVIAGWCSN